MSPNFPRGGKRRRRRSPFLIPSSSVRSSLSPTPSGRRRNEPTSFSSSSSAASFSAGTFLIFPLRRSPLSPAREGGKGKKLTYGTIRPWKREPKSLGRSALHHPGSFSKARSRAPLLQYMVQGFVSSRCVSGPPSSSSSWDQSRAAAREARPP